MPQVPVDKTFFAFTGGINTESHPLAFPEGTSLDEQNFDAKLNGARRRRRGLRKESGHSVADINAHSTYNSTMATSTFRWTTVAGNPDTTFICVQVGTALLFATEAQDLSPQFLTDYINLEDFLSSSAVTDVCCYPVSMSAGRGMLFVTGKYVDPFYVEYDASTQEFTANKIPLWIRDFRSVEDGIDLRATPTTLTDDHEYNLMNRGWPRGLIGTFFAAKSYYPAKNQQYQKGYRRLINASYSDIDGIKEFNSDKLLAEAFGDSSAPTGAYIINPFQTTYAKLGSGTLINIDTFSVADGGIGWLVTLNTTSAHGLIAADNFSITNNRFAYTSTSGTTITGTLDGSYTVNTAPGASQITFYMYKPAGYSTWATQYIRKGQIAEVVVRSNAYSTNERPQALAFFAGRVFYAGVAHPELNDTIMFSQIVEDNTQAGNCYQKNDPTSQYISALEATDGGTIVIPNLGQVYRMLPMENNLMVFAENGVWAILPSSQGGFRADGYGVRKISDVGCVGPQAVCQIDWTSIYASKRGVYVLSPDPNSGQIVPQSITDTTIASLWNDIPDARKREIQIVYDDTTKRVVFLYGDSTVTAARSYSGALVFDFRLAAWYKHTYPHSNTNGTWKLRGILATGISDTTETAKKIKFLGTKDNTGAYLNIYDLDQTSYADWDDTEQDAYIITGYDNLGDFARHRQAPVVHVYLQKTETGFTQNGDGSLEPVNPSSCLMQARWDWADHNNSGKWGLEQEVYRHTRYYQPSGLSDTFDSGLPVIVTRSKIRGRGRCLHLRFAASAGKDCYLLGWALEYKGEMRQ